jgi:glycerol kinase
MADGVFVSPLAAATKIEWILDRVDPDRAAVRAGRLACGTVDAWLAARLSAGQVFATDASNASCSGFYDFLAHGWSAAVLDALRVPASALPAVVDSSAVLGRLDVAGFPPLPIAALIGDQQAAMMGQLRLTPGDVKITYGTSAMVDLNAGAEPIWSTRAAYPLVLWQRDGVPTFCLEGTAITAGAAVTWLRDGIGLVARPEETAALAASVPDAGGAWAVPAFQGLGTPYMDTRARAVIGGLSRATTRAHVVRAVLEGIAWRCREVYDALRADAPFAPPATLRADGGAARNDMLLQLQADALGIPVERPTIVQAGALGAGYLAGLATGVWSSTDELARAWRRDRIFEPRLDHATREDRFAAWQRHVGAAQDTEG